MGFNCVGQQMAKTSEGFYVGKWCLIWKDRWLLCGEQIGGMVGGTVIRRCLHGSCGDVNGAAKSNEQDGQQSWMGDGFWRQTDRACCELEMGERSVPMASDIFSLISFEKWGCFSWSGEECILGEMKSSAWDDKQVRRSEQELGAGITNWLHNDTENQVTQKGITQTGSSREGPTPKWATPGDNA